MTDYSWNIICDPISVAHPTQREIQQSKLLEEFICTKAPFSTQEEEALKQNILQHLNNIVQEWADVIRIRKANSEPHRDSSEQESARIHTFGSYRLGVSTIGSDIDCLCIAPSFVERDEFFDTLLDRLKGETDITDILCVKATRVPIIKFTFCGVQIDLLFSRLAYPKLPKNIDLTADDILRNLDNESVLSINGCRVADQTLKLVSNLDTFRICLRAIKVWGKNRGLYNNMMGYLGGVHLSLLVARVCQLYPHAPPCRLLSRFFLFYDMWQWKNPIVLRQVRYGGQLGSNVWNPHKNVYVMAILTPAYPSNNASHNVSKSTLHLMKEEFHRGRQLLVTEKNQELSDAELLSRWKQLMEPSDFFYRYKKFLQIVVSTEPYETDCTRTKPNVRKWSGYVESRIRLLVTSLELVDGIQFAIPWHESMTIPRHESITDLNNQLQCCETIHYFIALVFDNKESLQPRSLDLSDVTNNWLSCIMAWNEKDPECTVLLKYIDNKKTKDFVFPNGQKLSRKRKRDKGQ